MNVTAIRWLRRLAKLGIVVAIAMWPLELILSGDQLLDALAPAPVPGGGGVEWRFLVRLTVNPITTAISALVASGLLFVGCEIALQMHRDHQFETSE